MIKKIIYFGIIVILTILLINYFGTKNMFQLSNNDSINATELVNNARYNPKRLYLSTWRLVKSKYYDPTLNRQDWYRWRSRYIDKIKTQEDAYVAINTMLASLNDQYSRFMSEEEFKSQNEEIDAKISGIGVTISSISGKIVILDVLKNTPANKAGIKPGDILTKVNGKDVHGLDLADVSKLIRGPIGSVVGVEFIRDKKKISYNIQRREIEIQSVESEMINNDIGYIIYVANPYYYKIDNEYLVYTYTNVKEDELSLYGFTNLDEKKMFLDLISVKGIGPKAAIAILASVSVEGIKDAIERENILYLKKIPKIGDKAARQIILDLKGKLASNNNVSTNNELSEALMALGYKQKDISKIINKVDINLTIEQQIKEALKLLLK